MKRVITSLLVGACSLSAVHAVPLLQLDIGGGTYNTTTESITTTASQFSLYALVDSAANKYKGLNNYYISAAIIPQPTHLDAGFGSFSLTLNGVTTTFNSQNMLFGTPPTDSTDLTEYEELTGVALPNHTPGSLSPHGTFPTSYGQLGFSFASANHAFVYNTQDDPGGLVDDASNGAALLYQEILVDLAGLAAGFEVHFDLYHLDTRNKVDQFAPFSHDAHSGRQDVPEGGSTLVLLGSGLFGLAALKRRFKK